MSSDHPQDASEEKLTLDDENLDDENLDDESLDDRSPGDRNDGVSDDRPPRADLEATAIMTPSPELLSSLMPEAPEDYDARTQAASATEGDSEPTESTGSATHGAARSDRGAAAALRTVRYRKPRDDQFALAGNDAGALARRRTLLKRLATRVSGGRKARILATDGELAEMLYDVESAKSAYQAAHEADPRDVVALRALRAFAIADGRTDELCDLLAAEARLSLSAEDKARVLSHLAEAHRSIGNLEDAEKAIRASLALDVTSAAGIFLAELCADQDRPHDVLSAITRAAEVAENAELKRALFAHAAELAERTLSPDDARDLYRKAYDSTTAEATTPEGTADSTAREDGAADSRDLPRGALSLSLGLVRSGAFSAGTESQGASSSANADPSASGGGAVDGASPDRASCDDAAIADELLKRLAKTAAPRLAEALTRLRAVWNRPDAEQGLSQSRQAADLELALELAPRTSQIEQWTQTCAPKDRTRAYLMLAEHQARTGAVEEADATLRLARSSAPDQTHIAWTDAVREQLAAELNAPEKLPARAITDDVHDRSTWELSAEHCAALAPELEREALERAAAAEAPLPPEQALLLHQLRLDAALSALSSSEATEPDARRTIHAALADIVDIANTSSIFDGRERRDESAIGAALYGLDRQGLFDRQGWDDLDALLATAEGSLLTRYIRAESRPSPQDRATELLALANSLGESGRRPLQLLAASQIALRVLQDTRSIERSSDVEGLRQEAGELLAQVAPHHPRTGGIVETLRGSLGLDASAHADAMRTFHERLGFDERLHASEQAEHLVQAALLGAALGISSDSADEPIAGEPIAGEPIAGEPVAGEPIAASYLRRAAERCPTDRSIDALALRLARLPPREVAALQLRGEGSTDERSAFPDETRAQRLRAAAAYEEAGDDLAAAALYREVLKDHLSDPLASQALDRVELRSGAGARVTSRRFAEVKHAEGDSKVAALEALADLDLYERDDAASATLTLQSILEIDPEHLPTLRRIQRHLMEHRRSDELSPVHSAMARVVGYAASTEAHIRLARQVQSAANTGAMAQRSTHVDAPTPWLARRRLAHRVEHRAPAWELLECYDAILQEELGADERVAIELARARCFVRMDGEAGIAPRDGDSANEDRTSLERLAGEVPDYPLARLALAAQARDADVAQAALALSQAADATTIQELELRLRYEAAVLYQDRLGDNVLARERLSQVTELDPQYRDAFERLSALLEGDGNETAMLSVLSSRVQAGGEPAVLAELQLQRAELALRLKKTDVAKSALRGALEYEPGHLGALKELSNLCLAEEDWRAATESLVRMAKSAKDEHDEALLRFAFFTLGDLYERHLGDPKRALAAFQQVTKREPNDHEAWIRQAELHASMKNLDASARVYQQLIKTSSDLRIRIDYCLRLSKCYETGGDTRRAEMVLESARKRYPTERDLVMALAAFYEHTGDKPALSMHLNRAATDLRRAVTGDSAVPAHWVTLTETLERRGRPHAADAVASVAYALGIRAQAIASRVDREGRIAALGDRIASDTVDARVQPEILSSSSREVFRLCSSAFDKLFPVDLKAISAERLADDHGCSRQASEIARWFGISTIKVWGAQDAPQACLPAATAPMSVVLGTALLERCSASERAFLLTRAIKIAHADLGTSMRIPPERMTLTLGGLLHLFDDSYRPNELSEADLSASAKKLSKALGRKQRKEIEAAVREMVAAPGFDPLSLGFSVSRFGNRIALLAHGDTGAALRALLRLASIEFPEPTDDEAITMRTRMAAIRSVPEAWALVEFILSDACFDAREAMLG